MQVMIQGMDTLRRAVEDLRKDNQNLIAQIVTAVQTKPASAPEAPTRTSGGGSGRSISSELVTRLDLAGTTPIEPIEPRGLGCLSFDSLPSLQQTTGAGNSLEQQYQELRELMYRIPGVAHPLEKAARDSYADSPFVDDIALIGVPKGCVPPAMTLYDGTADPFDHINHYNFADLVNAFNQQFASSRKPEKQTSDLYRIVQEFEESTRDYLNRFNKEKVSIPRCDITTAIQAFRRGLHQDSQLYKDLTMHPCTTFEEVQSKAIAVIRLEEDSAPVRGTYDSDPVSRKAPVEKKRERPKPYSRSVNKVSGNSEGKGEADLPPKVSEYGFTTNLAGLFKALKELGRRIRWPKLPEGNPSSRDTGKKCDFHGSNTHNTDECHSLRKEVKFHYDQGNLDYLLPRNTTRVNSADQVLPSPPPHFSRTVNVITGGSELCRLTYSTAKRHATRTKGDRPESSCRVNHQNLPSVTFDETYAGSAPEQHHDALIITLPIGNCKVKKILVDTGSSVNLIMMETLKGMGFTEKYLAKKAIPLVGFSGKTKHSLGEIIIPTYAGGVNKQVRYLVIDGPSTYKVILGRPWIHEMKAIPSTYHQCLKFPTPWGVQEIRGDQEKAKDCYKVALKPTTGSPA
ncbi:uncharacterized protein LOC141630404 [Silene latifolia]|uniref:uncharacterized protein LOC141630404 n=1 Tax=Silene latifolia TaxID=37657 RepID=UPI003D7880B7